MQVFASTTTGWCMYVVLWLCRDFYESRLVERINKCDAILQFFGYQYYVRRADRILFCMRQMTKNMRKGSASLPVSPRQSRFLIALAGNSRRDMLSLSEEVRLKIPDWVFRANRQAWLLPRGSWMDLYGYCRSHYWKSHRDATDENFFLGTIAIKSCSICPRNVRLGRQGRV